MKLKTTEVNGATYAEVKDGKPVYVDDDGKETALDGAQLHSSVTRLTDESKKFKQRAQEAEGKLKAFDGIEDAEAARAALEKVANYGDKELVEAGKVEEIKAAAIKAVEDRYKPVVEERDTLKGELYREKIGGAFARSPFVSEKLAIPSDLVEARFGGQFKIEEGKVVAYDQAGNAIYSKENPGAYAEFDEALSVLVDQYPQRDRILKGNGGSGTGKQPGGGAPTGEKTIKRADFDAMTQSERAAKISDGHKVVD